ncbi:hypothetical protein ACFVOK_32955 [Streptomyces sp. NPDC057798]|uniref:hypothetical protein n=1 Tax=Streptomyces sp. NPDC057798 TaxID=3346252 RepID=UPI003686DF58
MVEALYGVVRAAADLAEVVRRLVRDTHANEVGRHPLQFVDAGAHDLQIARQPAVIEDTSRKAEDAALAAAREHSLSQAVKGLRAAAADILSDSGIPHYWPFCHDIVKVRAVLARHSSMRLLRYWIWRRPCRSWEGGGVRATRPGDARRRRSGVRGVATWASTF